MSTIDPALYDNAYSEHNTCKVCRRIDRYCYGCKQVLHCNYTKKAESTSYDVKLGDTRNCRIVLCDECRTYGVNHFIRQ
jgi:hypothetical protein